MVPSTLTLTARPRTQIWRKSPNLDWFDAPRQLSPPAPLSTLVRARVTISGLWRARYDNAGLLLVFTDPTHPSRPQRWIKAGVEVNKDMQTDHPMLSVTMCDVAADRSMHPRDLHDEAEDETTVEIRLEKDIMGTSLYVYYLAMDGAGGVKERHPLREASWMFAGADLSCQVGLSASAPASGTGLEDKDLIVHFTRFQVEWAESEENYDN